MTMIQKILYQKTFSIKIVLLLIIFLTFFQNVYAERLSVIANKANIRSGPGPEYDILWQVEKHYPVEVIQKRGLWYLFKDFEGDKGWIHMSLVDPVETVITIREGKNNVRKGPDISYEKIFCVEKGVPFKVIEKKGRWLKIEHADGDTGWIYDSLVW